MRTLVLLLACLAGPSTGHPQPACAARPLSDQEVRDVVEREREARADLPRPFPEQRWVVNRQGCYYNYIEYGIPETFHKEQIFKLNGTGVIVDVLVGGDPSKGMKCPDRELMESELAQVVKKERARRSDLPPEFPRHETRVERSRCLYIYFEYALPRARGKYQAFTIDPFGGLIEFTRSQPY
jgi:hypothetical protein